MSKKSITHSYLFVLPLLLIGLTFALAPAFGRDIEKNFSIPAEFDQAPMLAEMVEKGELPPLEERLPRAEDVYVVDPIEEIGAYGGALKTNTLRANSFGNDSLFTAFTNLVKAGSDGKKLEPNVAKKIVSSPDEKVWTVHLREGLKWSDGHPFTAEDIMFWYEDVLLNEELTPVVGVAWKADGEVMELEKVDDYTVRAKFAAPKPYFPNRLYLWSPILYYAKHYLKQFHPKYVPMEELEKKVKEANFDNWWELFGNKNTNWAGQPLMEGRPTLGPYRLVKKSSDRRVYERNPYFWKVDTAGNQLPYIDRIETEVISDKEVGQGKIMSGEVDFSGLNTDIRNFPMYKRYEDQGNYRTILWKSGYGSEANYFFNLTHEDPEMREVFQDVRFRRAMSYAIDREEINDSIYFGKAKARQYTVLPISKFFEPEFAETYIEYDPERAKDLLEEVGLVDQDGDGWRDLPNGEKFNFTIEYYALETPKQPNVELVTQHWREVGVNVSSKTISGELQSQRASGNLMDSTLWHDGSAVDLNFPIDPRHVVPTWPRWEECTFTEWSRWFQTDGEAGTEPPAEMKEIRGWWEDMMTEPNEEKRIELGKKILAKQAEQLWTIGTIGETPWPLIVSKDMGNFPKEGRWAWGVQWLTSHNPCQLFFKSQK